ncbi:hypothetical protein [uncultured Erythrobacter sp.]|uniref:hypothetical protein n=1 Tax=uncultured Erythrobacter sp. TaxID=263913 RepID=UPI002605A3B0|nr:hypothetical protein [uncultured Erythrobacter sp.]
MNCIEATKFLHPSLHAQSVQTSLIGHCSEFESDACREYAQSLAHYQSIYWKAVAQSVTNFGFPTDWKDSERKVNFYVFSEQMEPYFARCLKDHPDPHQPPAENEIRELGDVPELIIYDRRQENRHCIPLGGNRPATLP